MLGLTIEYTDRYSTHTPLANSDAVLLLIHEPVNIHPNTVLGCYTDRHNTVIAVKGSTLDPASDGQDGHGGFAIASYAGQVPEQVPWRRSSGPVRRMAISETPICGLAPSHHGEAGVARPSSAETVFRSGKVVRFLVSYRCGIGLEVRGYRNVLVSDESMRRSSFCFRIRLAASVFDVGEVIVLCVT